jgi:phospholipase/carboxylesterase
VSSTIPQEQLSDTAPDDLQERVHARIAAFPGVTSRQSVISVPGARGFMLDPPRLGPDDAFLVPAVGEFAHLDPGYDGSLHVALPPVFATDLIAKGWGIAHALAGGQLTPGMVMLFGSRDADELEVVTGVVVAGHAWGSGPDRVTGDQVPAAPSPIASRDGGTECRPALQVSAHQFGSLITTENSRRWWAGL